MKDKERIAIVGPSTGEHLSRVSFTATDSDHTVIVCGDDVEVTDSRGKLVRDLAIEYAVIPYLASPPKLNVKIEPQGPRDHLDHLRVGRNKY